MPDPNAVPGVGANDEATPTSACTHGVGLH